MAYIKYGVVTKIEIIKNIDKSNEFIEKNFDLNLYNKKDKSYYLQEGVLSGNIQKFRGEIMKYTDSEGDSLNNCEAYCLETSIEEVMKSKINMIQNNERYYFSCNKKIVFDADKVMISNKDIKVQLFIIPVFWDINRVMCENFVQVLNFMNNISRKTFVNSLKDASFFVVV